MTSNLCSECKIFPTQHHCSLCKTVLVCTMCCLKRGLAEMVFVCVTCDENRKNDTKSRGKVSPHPTNIDSSAASDKTQQEGSLKLVCCSCNDAKVGGNRGVIAVTEITVAATTAAFGSLKVSFSHKISQNNHFSSLIPSTTCA